MVAMAFSPDSARLAGAVGSSVYIWNLPSSLTTPPSQNAPPAPSSILRGHQDQVLSVAFSPDGLRAVSGSNDKTVRIWDLRRGGGPLLLQGAAPQTMFSSRPSHVVTVSADGNRVYSGTPNGSVRAWDLRAPGADPELLLSERMRASATGPSQGRGSSDLRAMDLSADGSRIALAGRDAEARVWDVRNPNAPPIELPNRDRLPPMPNYQPGSSPPVTTLEFSPDNSELALTRMGADTVWLWDLRTRRARSLPLQYAGLAALAYSPDGTRFAAGNLQEIRIWDLRMTDASPVVIRHMAQAMSAMAFSRDNARLVVAAEDVRVWDLSSRSPVSVPVRGGPAGIRPLSLAFSSDDELVAVGNAAGVTVWDVRNLTSPLVSLRPSTEGGPVALLPSGAIAFASDNQRLVVGGNDGSVRVWSLGAAAADALCTRVARNLSMAEWRQHVGERRPLRTHLSRIASRPGSALIGRRATAASRFLPRSPRGVTAARNCFSSRRLPH